MTRDHGATVKPTIWLRLHTFPNGDATSVEIPEPDTGPYFVGRHSLGERWRWYEAGQLWGPSCRWKWSCRFLHWRHRAD